MSTAQQLGSVSNDASSASIASTIDRSAALSASGRARVMTPTPEQRDERVAEQGSIGTSGACASTLQSLWIHTSRQPLAFTASNRFPSLALTHTVGV